MKIRNFHYELMMFFLFMTVLLSFFPSFFLQAIPRAVWLDANGRQLMQWPISEVELLRGRKVHLQNIELKQGGLVEVKGVTASQVSFFRILFQHE